ncbi:glycerophosphodiester phosphodiesterase family protein [Sinanaerobacter sp. ZZT-01]|uniref:glycerophosphodiester phosphodiesterase family protein n=1 Tax=Sinanaerobacter sp. ZZT-01 TaxID=3111540 RepID=UPI002D792AC7|nr:glycerophosphodiester phosphodiesterase family protein [Sinanaerobacter sp. ZZT-01]WRR92317.1 glycerophosphodiester phosphodiesterase family protein [Sinanaerobacter sp. ZZT-01]
MKCRQYFYRTLLCLFSFVFIVSSAAMSVSYAAEANSSRGNTKYERLIAHGGGSIQGYYTTNSMEAVEKAIEYGFRLIELDLGITKDQEIVMLHDWDYTSKDMLGLASNSKLTLDQFEQTKIFEKFEPMTFEKLAALLQDYPEVRIITDTKEDNIKLLTLIAKKYPKCKEQIIPQIYSFDEWNAVKGLGYKQIILTLYKMQSLSADKIIRFVKSNRIYAVTMSEELRNKGIAKKLQSYGIVVYMHTINDVEEMQDAKSKGAYGIYTDDLIPSDWNSMQSGGYYFVKTGSGNTGKRLDYEFFENEIFLKVKGNNSRHGDKVQFSSGDQSLGEAAVGTEFHLDKDLLSSGKHQLTATVVDSMSRKIAKLTYYIWIDKGPCQITNEVNEYLLDNWGLVPDFEAILEEEDSEIQEILKGSILSRSGQSLYYINGKPNFYSNGKRLEKAYTDAYGNTMVHLGTIGIKLGAASVYMDNTKMMRITDKGKLYTSKVGSNALDVGSSQRILNQKTVLIQGRVYAAGELYQEIFHRNFLDENGILILLPEDKTLKKEEQQKLLNAAKKLFEQE